MSLPTPMGPRPVRPVNIGRRRQVTATMGGRNQRSMDRLAPKGGFWPGLSLGVSSARSGSWAAFLLPRRSRRASLLPSIQGSLDASNPMMPICL